MKKSFNKDYLKEKYPNYNINFDESEDIVGKGKFGEISKFNLNIEKSGKSRTNFIGKLFNIFNKRKNSIIKKSNFIIKKFEDENDCIHSLEFFQYLKSNNVPTFNTYRKYTNDSIIMTDLSLNNKFCVSVMKSNQTNSNKDHMNLIRSGIKISNLEELVMKIHKILLKFDELNIDYFYKDKLVLDYIFFIGNKSRETDIYVIVGDFDCLSINKNKMYTEYEINSTLYLFMFNLIRSYVPKLYMYIYLKTVQKTLIENIDGFDIEIFKEVEKFD